MSPHLIALLWLLAPQAPPIHVNINVYIENLLVSETAALAAELFSVEACNEVTSAYWAEHGYDRKLFGMNASETQLAGGNFCDPFSDGEKPFTRTP